MSALARCPRRRGATTSSRSHRRRAIHRIGEGATDAGYRSRRGVRGRGCRGRRTLIVFVAMYVSTGLGITVGFHRHFTHRSFKAAARCGPFSHPGFRRRSRDPDGQRRKAVWRIRKTRVAGVRRPH